MKVGSCILRAYLFIYTVLTYFVAYFYQQYIGVRILSVKNNIAV